MQIEVAQILNGFGGSTCRDFPRPREATQPLNDLDVDEVRSVELVVIAEEARLNPCAE